MGVECRVRAKGGMCLGSILPGSNLLPDIAFHQLVAEIGLRVPPRFTQITFPYLTRGARVEGNVRALFDTGDRRGPVRQFLPESMGAD